MVHFGIQIHKEKRNFNFFEGFLGGNRGFRNETFFLLNPGTIESIVHATQTIQNMDWFFYTLERGIRISDSIQIVKTKHPQLFHFGHFSDFSKMSKMKIGEPLCCEKNACDHDGQGTIPEKTVWLHKKSNPPIFGPGVS
jgi:hypothetical protein